MADHSDDALGQAASQLAELLQHPPEPGEKRGLGKIQSALDAVRDALDAAGERPHLRSVLEQLDILCTEILLDETDDPAAAETRYLDAARAVRDLLAGDDPEAAETLAAELAAELGGEAAPAESNTESEPPTVDASAPSPAPAMDLPDVKGEEDVIIYTEFLSESSEHLEKIEGNALELETSGDLDLVNEMFRCFHSMKGAAGFLGLTVINGLCHEVETLLDRARKLTLAIDGESVDVILAAIDCAKRLLACLQLHMDRQQGKISAETEIPTVDTRPVLAAVRHLLDRPALAPRAMPTGEDGQPRPDRVGGMLVADGVISQEDLGEALDRQKKPVGEILVEMGRASTDDVQRALARQGPARVGSIKVDTDRLDQLMEMVGELAIAESIVANDDNLNREENVALSKNVGNLSKITRNLQELVMSLRMVPLRQTFQKMMRLVRDTAQKTNKEARLELSGEDTEIDKTVIDQIADPLVHLLRNAVDHGLEPPDDREAAGKPREGRIGLNAFHQGGKVVIEVTDDGKGLHRDRILKKALERGLARETENYTDAEIFDFIFQPGFSTHDKATDISGRGVGMDVVKSNIERLGGKAEVSSEPGRGSVFTIRLPLTMALVDGMIVRVGEDRLVVPTLGIEESLRPTPESLGTVVNRGEMLRIRGDLVPMVRLYDLLNISDGIQDPFEALVIITQSDGRRCGLMVDELLGQQQVVIKSLGKRLQGIKGISGGCILGDGRVGLILDVGGITDIAQKQ